MKKQFVLIFGVILIILVVAGFVWYGVSRRPARVESQLNKRIQITKQERTEKSVDNNYELHIAYPAITGLPEKEAVAHQLTLLMEQVAVRRAEDFKKNAVSHPNADVGPLPGGNTLELSYEIQLPKKPLGNLVSILFLETSYYDGAAHPGHIYFSYIFDLSNGKEIKLADIFAADDVYGPLSQLATQQLRASFVKQDIDEGGWFPDGAAPKEENFQVYTLTNEGLVLSFNEYQVAPYAAGPQKVVIPFNKLSALQPRLWK